MPARQPFTQICQQTARGPHAGRVVLHIHSTCSDGQYTPAEIVQLGLHTGLSALAITDHDTLEAVSVAPQSAVGSNLEIVPGVEITTEYQGRELHLLGYYVRCDDPSLQSALAKICQSRVERFHEMVGRLRACNVSLVRSDERLAVPAVPGRRHLAEALIRGGYVRTLREAFQRYLGDNG